MSTDPDLLTDKELRDFSEALTDHANLLRAAAGAAMDLAEQVFATHELRKNAIAAAKKQEAVLTRIVKARGRTLDEVKEVDRERAVVVWK